MPRPTLKRHDYEALAGFRYELRKFLRFSKERLGRVNLTPEQYEALLALCAFGPEEGMRVGALSERLQVKHHTAVALSDVLAKRKLVTKNRAGEDRRHVYVRITARGYTTLRAMAAVHREEMRKRSGEMIQALLELRK
jgi:DNA-binding MarR family transcriptional regulator